MSVAENAASAWARWRQAAEVYRNRKQLIILLMGFSSGAPFLLTLSVLTYWMASVNVDLTTIGLFSLVGTPYAFKFVWAPLIDRLPLPVLDAWLGRRRSWMLVSQVGVLLSVMILAWSDPNTAPWSTAGAAVLVAFWSATQDIVIDAYRIELLNDEEQGAGSATTQLGYRIALWIIDALALLLPAFLPWPYVLTIIAMFGFVGIATTFHADEPHSEKHAVTASGSWLGDAVIRPFAEFIAHRGWVLILLFALFYKYGDALGGTMARPFYLQMGFTGPEIFAVTKSFGAAAVLLGGLAGGVLVAINTRLNATEIGYILEHSGARWVFASPELVPLLESLERRVVATRKKAQGGDADNYESVRYEGYAPGGVAAHAHHTANITDEWLGAAAADRPFALYVSIVLGHRRIGVVERPVAAYADLLGARRVFDAKQVRRL